MNREVLTPLAITIIAAMAAHWPLRVRELRRAPTVATVDEAGSDAIALLDGLRPGDTLASFRVRRIRAPSDRRLMIELEGTSLVVVVAALGVDPHSAPRTTALYAIFYQNAGSMSWPEVEPVVAAVESRVRRGEQASPRPRGM